jgi:hypothetical protein
MYNKFIRYLNPFTGGIMMITDFLFELKNWWFGVTFDEVEEFERLESKHTRVHHDENIYEIIRVH